MQGVRKPTHTALTGTAHTIAHILLPPVQGARKHLERGHAQHTRNTVLRHKVQAERGADPEQLREVQAYIQVGAQGVSRLSGSRFLLKGVQGRRQ